MGPFPPALAPSSATFRTVDGPIRPLPRPHRWTDVSPSRQASDLRPGMGPTRLAQTAFTRVAFEADDVGLRSRGLRFGALWFGPASDL